jgi:2-dehydro-3-deoxyphosphogluconate aldolase/(4S)-4-hydroxy-2-oxoglutarate aldolase
MSPIEKSFDIVLKQKMLPLYFNEDKDISLEVLKALYNAGIRSVEYTNRGAAALENFKAMVALRNTELPGMELGIGTIKTVADAQLFIEAGANYIICPGLIPDVVRHVQKAGLLCVPGCMTTSEIIAAEQLGITFIKLFPGSLIGPAYVSAIKDIFPNLYFMPTGGVENTVENIQAWFDAGVCAVGMGSKLLSKTLVNSSAYKAIETATKDVLAIVQNIK